MISKRWLVIINIRTYGGEDYCPGDRTSRELRQAGLQHQFVDSKLDKVNPFQQSLHRSSVLSNYSIRLSAKNTLSGLWTFFSSFHSMPISTLLLCCRCRVAIKGKMKELKRFSSYQRHDANPRGLQVLTESSCGAATENQQTPGSPTPA